MKNLVKSAVEAATHHTFKVEGDPMATTNSWALKLYLVVSRYCALLTGSAAFTNLVIVCIIVAGVS